LLLGPPSKNSSAVIAIIPSGVGEAGGAGAAQLIIPIKNKQIKLIETTFLIFFHPRFIFQCFYVFYIFSESLSRIKRGSFDLHKILKLATII